MLNNQGWQKRCWLTGWLSLNGDAVSMVFVRSLELGVSLHKKSHYSEASVLSKSQATWEDYVSRLLWQFHSTSGQTHCRHE